MTATEPAPSISLAPQAVQSEMVAASPDEHAFDSQRDDAQKRTAAAFVTTLPLRLDVKIPMPNFRLKDLTHLAAGQVLQSEWSVAEDLPVSVGDIKLLWAEFAVADQQLTVRVTRIA